MNAIADVHFLQPQTQSSQLERRFDEEYGVYWALMNPRFGSFNAPFLSEVRGFIDDVVEANGMVRHKGQEHPVQYVVLASKMQNVFSLGGDLALFRSAIVRKDQDQLLRYGNLCISNLLPWHRNFNLPLTTISLVQGTAFGGGFEGALASSVVVAEESARMGFPEILFNLFPGMGAYSFLSRKVGRRITEELVTSGDTYSARQLFDMGVVDVLTPDGTGEAAVYSYVRKHAKSGNGRRGIEKVRTDLNPITHEELARIVEVWVDAAMKLEQRDLKMMERLVRAQQRNAADAAAEEASPITRLEAVGGAD